MGRHCGSDQKRQMAAAMQWVLPVLLILTVVSAMQVVTSTLMEFLPSANEVAER